MILDLFAGPGGWSEGLRSIGLSDIGIELDEAACATRTAAGHRTVRADLSTYGPRRGLRGRVAGLIASPPCQDFSMAGKRAGRAGERGQLVDIVPLWVDAVRPTWIACEQVPPVEPIWHEHALLYRSWGYSTWTGVLNAADYGVPQTRRRAILIAHRDRTALPPEPTHGRNPEPGLFGTLEPWVSMAEALGWGFDDTPARTMCGDRSPRWLYPDPDGTHGRVLHTTRRGTSFASEDGKQHIPMSRPAPAFTGKSGGQWLIGSATPWPFTEPATTIAGDPRITARCHHDEGSQGRDPKTTEQVQAGDYEGTEPIRLTVEQASILQGFPPNYPWQGTKTKRFEQVGNAVPPPLAAAVVGALLGLEQATP